VNWNFMRDQGIVSASLREEARQFDAPVFCRRETG